MTISPSWRPYIIWAIMALALIALFWLSVWVVNRPDKLDNFTACLKDRGAVLYGAFWCPHCQEQKSAFGRSVRLLPYIECSTPDGMNEVATCLDQKIEGYPTWVFSDGSRESGKLSLQRLADKTGCALPAN